MYENVQMLGLSHAQSTRRYEPPSPSAAACSPSAHLWPQGGVMESGQLDASSEPGETSTGISLYHCVFLSHTGPRTDKSEVPSVYWAPGMMG